MNLLIALVGGLVLRFVQAIPSMLSACMALVTVRFIQPVVLGFIQEQFPFVTALTSYVEDFREPLDQALRMATAYGLHPQEYMNILYLGVHVELWYWYFLINASVWRGLKGLLPLVARGV